MISGWGSQGVSVGIVPMLGTEFRTRHDAHSHVAGGRKKI